MNRLTNVVQLTNAAATASAWYSYDAAGRLWKKGYGNGDVVTHSYDTESRLLSLGITNNTTPVWWWTYGWDNGGNILAITNNGTNVSLYGYDRAGQLTNEVCLTNGIAGGETNTWVYDEAGNWRTGDGKWRLYNTDNELVGIATSNAPVSIPITVTGEVEPGPNSNKWYNTWASSRGVSAQVSPANGTFSLASVPLYPGTNDLTVTVTDVSGNTTQQVRTVSRPLPETFRYDGNGNLTNWISGTTNWVYEWDWADRLTKVSSNGVTVLENWYDADSRRIAKKELVNGQTRYTLHLWDGWASAAVLNQSAQVLETFTHGAGYAGAIGTLVAVTHHASSITNGVFYGHQTHRADISLTRSGTTTIGRYEYSAFGAVKSQTGSDVCRFTFSSKEREASCGLIYYGYRFYAPPWQRWLGRDPVCATSAANTYAFALNGPICHADPDGRVAIAIPIGGIVIVVGGGVVVTIGQGLTIGLTIGLAICLATPSCRDALLDTLKRLLDKCKSQSSPWTSGPACQGWLADPLGNVSGCRSCCAEQMGIRQALHRPAQEMADELAACQRGCDKSNGLHGPHL